MSRSQFQSNRFILRHAWLNLWDERMTTGRINQVAIFPRKGTAPTNAARTTTFQPTLLGPAQPSNTPAVLAARGKIKKWKIIKKLINARFRQSRPYRCRHWYRIQPNQSLRWTPRIDNGHSASRNTPPDHRHPQQTLIVRCLAADRIQRNCPPTTNTATTDDQ